MLRKLRAIVTAGSVGALGGALLGGFAWLIEALGGGTGLLSVASYRTPEDVGRLWDRVPGVG